MAPTTLRGVWRPWALVTLYAVTGATVAAVVRGGLGRGEGVLIGYGCGHTLSWLGVVPTLVPPVATTAAAGPRSRVGASPLRGACARGTIMTTGGSSGGPGGGSRRIGTPSGPCRCKPLGAGTPPGERRAPWEIASRGGCADGRSRRRCGPRPRPRFRAGGSAAAPSSGGACGCRGGARPVGVEVRGTLPRIAAGVTNSNYKVRGSRRGGSSTRSAFIASRGRGLGATCPTTTGAAPGAATPTRGSGGGYPLDRTRPVAH